MKTIKEQLINIKSAIFPDSSPPYKIDNKSTIIKNSTIPKKKLRISCPECNCKLNKKNYYKHLYKNHNISPAGKSDKGVEFNRCLICKTDILNSNFLNHVNFAHKYQKPRQQKHRKIRKKCKNSKTYTPPPQMTVEEAIEIKKALSEQDLISNKNIAEYLKRNPVKNGLGKFGIPQDKYRHGFYGSKGMDYDVWSNGEKKN